MHKFNRIRHVATIGQTTIFRDLCKNGWTERFAVWVVDSGRPKEAQVQLYSPGGARMWADAQRDGRPAEYRWRPLFNPAKFGWRPTLPRCESRWNLQGCPKLTNRSQPLLGRSSPYYEDMWRRYLCLTIFFLIVDTCLSCEDTARQVVQWCQNGDFLHPVFSANRVQHISDMHSKFALRPHHVWKYGRHPISDRWN